MAAHPDFLTLAKLKGFLSRGRHDYDWVASRIYAACYNDENVLKKILAANPEDAPSSDEEYSTSEDEVADIDEEFDQDSDENEDNESKESGSKGNPVVLDENAGEDESRKRKREVSGTENEAAKKTKQSNEKVLCVNCGSKFNSGKNKDGACRYHPSRTILGELEDNPTCDDISDDEDSRDTWPNAFLWECCETNFEDDDAPCESGKHVSEGDRTEFARRKQTERKHTKYYG